MGAEIYSSDTARRDWERAVQQHQEATDEPTGSFPPGDPWDAAFKAEPRNVVVGRVLPPEPPPISTAEKDALWETICDSARGS